MPVGLGVDPLHRACCRCCRGWCRRAGNASGSSRALNLRPGPHLHLTSETFLGSQVFLQLEDFAEFLLGEIFHSLVMTDDLLGLSSGLRVGVISCCHSRPRSLVVARTAEGGYLSTKIALAQSPVIMFRLSRLRLIELVSVGARFNLSRQWPLSTWHSMLPHHLLSIDHATRMPGGRSFH